MMHAPTIPLDPAEQAKRLYQRQKRLEFQANNEAKTCTVPACSRPRYQMGQYCRSHHAVAAWSGDARAVQIRRRQTDRYEKQFTEFCERFPEHPAIKAGEDFLNALLEDPRRFTRSQIIQDRVTGAWLRDARGPEMLKILAGCYLLSRYEPLVLPDDDRLKFLLAKRFISTWRRGRKNTTGSRDNAASQGPLKRPTTTLRELGTLLHKYLGTLMARVADRMDKDTAELQHFRTAAHQPFHTAAEIAAAQQFNLDKDEE